MGRVSITKSKLDALAIAVAKKSGESVPLTIDQMTEAVDDIQSGTTVEALSVTQNGTYTAPSGTAYSPVTVAVPTPTPTLQTKTATYTPSESQQTDTITPDSGYDGLSEVDVTVGAISSTYVGSGIERRTDSDVEMDIYPQGAWVWMPAGYYAEPAQYQVPNGSLVSDIEYVDDEPSVTVDSSGVVHVSGGYSANLSPVSTSGWINSSATIPTDIGVSGTYQLSTQAATTITPTTSAQTAVAAGKYTTGAVTVAAMPTGTAGTPTATKGTVSNHSVSVTPSVTNTTGYITGSTKTGTAVTVSASELVSGTLTISASGTHDVTNYASASVASGSATASATKGTVSNHSVTVTPSVTRTAGYVTAGTASGTAVTVSASELVSGSETKTANGTYDVTNLASVVVAIPIQHYYTGSSTPSSSLGADGDIYLKT